MDDRLTRVPQRPNGVWREESQSRSDMSDEGRHALGCAGDGHVGSVPHADPIDLYRVHSTGATLLRSREPGWTLTRASGSAGASPSRSAFATDKRDAHTMIL